MYQAAHRGGRTDCTTLPTIVYLYSILHFSLSYSFNLIIEVHISPGRLHKSSQCPGRQYTICVQNKFKHRKSSVSRIIDLSTKCVMLHGIALPNYAPYHADHHYLTESSNPRQFHHKSLNSHQHLALYCLATTNFFYYYE